MEKLESVRKGKIWMNIFETDDKKLIFNFNKTYYKKSEWHKAEFFTQEETVHISMLIEIFHEFEKIYNNNQERQDGEPAF